jgi:hypothetical protein
MSEQTPWNANGVTAPQPPPAPPRPQDQRPHRRGGIGAGVILIALGVLFLIGQFVPGLAWWQMWPLLVILIGGIQLVTPDPKDGWGLPRVMDGIGTVIFGAVLLGNTTGFISWGVWWTLLTLWPVVLVAIGIAIIGRALGQSWLRALSPVVIWIALGYSVATAFTGAGGYRPIAPVVVQSPGQSFSYSEPVGGVSSAKLDFKGGAGEIGIQSVSDQLVTAQGTAGLGTPSFSVSRSGDTADVALGLSGDTVVIVPGFTAGKVDVGLSDSVVWDATLSTGATNLDADFSHVKLSALTLKTGVSNANLQLGALPDSVSRPKIVVKAGVSSVTIRVPRDVEARVQTSNGLSSLNVSNDFRSQSGGVWTTPGYSDNGQGYDIQVESGVGSVSIRTY